MANNSGVPSFFDVKDIGSLATQPLSKDDARLKEELTSCGAKFVALRGMHYLEYEGHIIQQDPKAQTAAMPMPMPGVVMAPPQPLRFQVSSV